MAAAGGIRVEGLSAAVRQLGRLGVDLDQMKDFMEGVAREATQLGHAGIPKLSGALDRTIRGNRAKGSATVTFGRGKVNHYVGRVLYQPGFSARGYGLVQRIDEQMSTHVVGDLERAVDRLIRQNGCA